jgi:hypothetical protein
MVVGPETIVEREALPHLDNVHLQSLPFAETTFDQMGWSNIDVLLLLHASVQHAISFMH